MSTIYLLRHCEYDNPRHILPGRLPVELSEKGKKQAKKLRDFFADKQIEKIYSSQVLRCKQTSEVIAQGKIPIEFDKRLLEVMIAYQGYWTEDSNYAYWMRKSLGGELNVDVQKRMVDFWENTKFEDNKNYIISSHGDPIYILFRHLKQIPLFPEYKFGQQMILHPDYPEMGSFYVVEKEKGKWKVKGPIELPDV